RPGIISRNEREIERYSPLALTGEKRITTPDSPAFAQSSRDQPSQRRKPEIAQAVFGATLDAFRMRSRVAYSGQQMLEEYVSFYQ
ncbi:hypothetical protein MJM04_32410, partial [Salmonella enterica subsp. enterica serovar Cerro]|nr:hypothetical protein [Salmonella enterica subsp. enterica serovar Cerro]